MRLRTVFCSLALLTGGALSLTSVVSAQGSGHNFRCLKAARRPPAVACVVACTAPPGTVSCGAGANVQGSWIDGDCVTAPNRICYRTIEVKCKPVYQCREKLCVTGTGATGSECYWFHVGDDATRKVRVNNCVNGN